MWIKYNSRYGGQGLMEIASVIKSKNVLWFTLSNGIHTDWGIWNIDYENISEEETLNVFNKIEQGIIDNIKIVDFTYLK